MIFELLIVEALMNRLKDKLKLVVAAISDGFVASLMNSSVITSVQVCSFS
jgi:hypothetical protein